MANLTEGQLFSIGNPLLDISANVNDEFLQKYKLPKNAAIIADKTQESLYEELVNKFEIDYSAGGAAQNTMRFCQWILGTNQHGIATFLGCIGDDYFGKMMESKAKSDGVKVLYEVEPKATTGTCAVLITDHGTNRSLCAYLGAAEKLTKHHVLRHWHWVEKAKVFYIAGHSLSVTADSCIAIAKETIHDKYNPKMLCFNLAAPYVSEKFGKELMEIVPYINYFFGNEYEAAAFAKMRGYNTTDMKEITKKMANEPCKNGVRFAIVTQGPNPVLYCKSGTTNVIEVPVPKIDEEKVIDTNGAGDAFTGGFLAMFLKGESLDVCIRCGIYCAGECIQRLGCVFPKEFNFKK